MRQIFLMSRVSGNGSTSIMHFPSLLNEANERSTMEKVAYSAEIRENSRYPNIFPPCCLAVFIDLLTLSQKISRKSDSATLRAYTTKTHILKCSKYSPTLRFRIYIGLPTQSFARNHCNLQRQRF